MTIGPEAGRRLRRAAFIVHQWLGLALGLWFALLGLTGSVLAWGPELIRYEMTRRDPLERQHPSQPMIPLSAAVEALERAVPDLRPGEAATVVIPNFRYPHFLFPMRRDGGLVYKVDPYSGTVHAPYRKTDLVIGVISSFHESLILGPRGLLANAVGSALALVMLATGLWLWWPATVAQFRRRLSVRRGSKPTHLLLDLHNVAGVYPLLIVVVTTATAVYLATDSLTDGGLTEALGGAPAPPAIGDGPPLGDDVLLAAAVRAMPEADLVLVRRAVAPGSPFEATFRSPRGLLAGGEVVVDPATGAATVVARGAQAPAGDVLHLLAEDLHFGIFGGWPTKCLYTVAGLSPSMLFVTGAWVWWLKRARRRLKPIEQATPVAGRP